ncbi:GFA family protein [Aurantiacibacter hainanensis]|uniref:GFA family protein n=1 Tax=Aurantiacibacter hainanensis TaxID=3076114 RepID=UPI0030C75144
MTAAAIEGHCLCGAVTITLVDPKQSVEICHCDMCRRTGGPFYAALAGESFTIAGEDAISRYRSSEWAERAFCGTCGCNLWYKFLPTGNRSFHAGLFSDADAFAVEKEIFVDEKARWAEISGDHPRQTGEEVIEEAKAAGFTFD